MESARRGVAVGAEHTVGEAVAGTAAVGGGEGKPGDLAEVEG
jgi:hypothetical protein